MISPAQRPLGFTLVEMMLVVVLASVLAVLGVYGVRKYIFSARSTEAIVMLGEIKKMQEAYMEETFTYLDVSANLNAYYPMDAGETPGEAKWSWDNPGHPDYAGWQQLNVSTNQPVAYGYVTVAGGPADVVPQPGQITQVMNFPDPPGRWWYLVKAVADMDGNGVYSAYVGSSFTAEIYGENEGE